MTEQERFEASIATRIHPVNFTKVNDLPILGWNGAKPNDYVDPKIQQHWITWQAAQQKEGYVLVPFDQAKDTERLNFVLKNQPLIVDDRDCQDDDYKELPKAFRVFDVLYACDYGRYVGSEGTSPREAIDAAIKAAQEAE